MALVKSVADWVQVVLNAGALVTGGVVWKMYFENLKATVSTKDAQISLANKQVDYWREKAQELEKRSPEAVERVLAERISIREKEIERLSSDREHSTQELGRVEEEVRVLNQTLEQTKGFLAVLKMEAPDANDPNYDEYMEYLKQRADRVVEVEVDYMGVVSVDSGQLMITDPCYIDGQWQGEPYDNVRKYRDTQTEAEVAWYPGEVRYTEPLEPYGQTVPALVEAGRLVELPPPPPPEKFHYSYNGACEATQSKDGFGELVFPEGHPGAGVAFQSGWGDGYYEVYGEKHNGRIMRVYINCGADPIPLSQVAPHASEPPD
ncbi:hypothetical protein ACWCOV_40785 [Kribbella sp. NPDC002412]